MKLELTLVKSQSIFSNIFKFISRKRYDIQNDSDTMKSVLNFIAENNDIISNAASTKGLSDVTKLLETTDSLSFDDFMCLKFLLNSRCGIDILCWCVSDIEVDENEVGDGTLEYNVVDQTYGTTMNTRLSTKFTVPSDNFDISNIYVKISKMYGLFESPIFQTVQSPLNSDIDVLKAIGKFGTTTGDTFLNNTMMHLGSTLGYLGKDLIVILNE